MEKQKRTLGVVIPVFNEEEVIGVTHKKIVEELGSLEGYSLEITYIDDGSTDNTAEILSRLAHENDNVKYIQLSRNFGHQCALSAGLDHASGDLIAVLDADLQDPPEVVVSMIKLWEQGYEVIYGIRQKRKESVFKRAAYNLFYKFWQYSASIEVPLDAGDFCLMDRKVVNALCALPENGRFVRGLRAWVGFKQIGLPYERMARYAGETKYPLSKLIKLSSDGIFNFSLLPLKLISIAGLIVFLAALLMIGLLLVVKLFDISIFGHTLDEMPGYTSLAILFLFMSGTIMLCLGILGEYIGRLYDEVKRRPNYVIHTITHQSAKTHE